MKKYDMKKLALLGLASGLIVSGQASAEANFAGGELKGTQIARGGCGSKCGSQSTRDRRYNGSYEISDNSEYQPPSHSCSSHSSPYQYQTSDNYEYQGPSHSCQSYNQGPSHSCQSYQGPSHSCQSYNQGPSHSCQSYQGPQSYNQGPSHSCSSQSPYQYQGNRTSQPRNDRSYTTANDQESGNGQTYSQTRTMTESDLLNQLNDQGKAIYNGLDTEGKALAIRLANQSCKGQNGCKGLNSCKSDKNSCAGEAECKGHSKCRFADKNLAVKVAAKKMASKRGDLMNKTNSRYQY